MSASVTRDLDKTVVGVTGLHGLHALLLVEWEKSLEFACATHLFLSWMVNPVLEVAGKQRSAKKTLVQSMETGDHGQNGMSALLHVAVEFRSINASVTTQHPSMEASLVWVQPWKHRSVTNKTVQLMAVCPILVSLDPHAQAFLMGLGNVAPALLVTVEMAFIV